MPEVQADQRGTAEPLAASSSSAIARAGQAGRGGARCLCLAARRAQDRGHQGISGRRGEPRLALRRDGPVRRRSALSRRH